MARLLGAGILALFFSVSPARADVDVGVFFSGTIHGDGYSLYFGAPLFYGSPYGYWAPGPYYYGPPYRYQYYGTPYGYRAIRPHYSRHYYYRHDTPPSGGYRSIRPHYTRHYYRYDAPGRDYRHHDRYYQKYGPDRYRGDRDDMRREGHYSEPQRPHSSGDHRSGRHEFFRGDRNQR